MSFSYAGDCLAVVSSFLSRRRLMLLLICDCLYKV